MKTIEAINSKSITRKLPKKKKYQKRSFFFFFLIDLFEDKCSFPLKTGNCPQPFYFENFFYPPQK
jgi:hypothetical protein